MFAVILSEDDAFYRSVAHRSRLHKYSVVRYRDPVKLADNLPELRPELLIIRGMDFPLHWEAIASQLLCTKNLNATKVVLFLSDSGGPVRAWPNVSVLFEATLPGSGPALSDETSKELSTLLSPGRNMRQAHDSQPSPPSPSTTQGLASSRLNRAAGKSSTSKAKYGGY